MLKESQASRIDHDSHSFRSFVTLHSCHTKKPRLNLICCSAQNLSGFVITHTCKHPPGLFKFILDTFTFFQVLFDIYLFYSFNILQKQNSWIHICLLFSFFYYFNIFYLSHVSQTVKDYDFFQKRATLMCIEQVIADYIICAY